MHSILLRISKNDNIIALQDASIAMLPFVVSIAAVLMLANGVDIFITVSFLDDLAEIHRYFYTLFPFIFIVSLSISFTKIKGMDPLPIIFVCLSILVVFALNNATTIEDLREYIYLKLIPIPLCYLTIKVFLYLSSKGILKDFDSSYVPLNLTKSLNNILPSLLTFCFVLSIFWLLETASNFIWSELTQEDFIVKNVNNPIYMLVTRTFMKVVWFFGVHADHAFTFLVAPYNAALEQNIYAYQNGLPLPNKIDASLFVYSDIGGSGSVLCLLIAIFIGAKRKRDIEVAKLSSLPCIFNISEILHFGLPIAYNPYLFIPFVTVPALLFLNTYIFIELGLMSPSVKLVPWTMPPLLNAYLSSGGQWSAIVLQLMNIVIGVGVYTYFIKLSERLSMPAGAVAQLSHDESLSVKCMQALQYKNQQFIIESFEHDHQTKNILSDLSSGELMIYYQPIVSSTSKEFFKFEALIRLKDKEGNILAPYFIDELSKAGLSYEIDKWVADTVLKNSFEWPDSSQDTIISINIFPESLLNRDFIDHLIVIQHNCKYTLSVEILEHQTIFEEQKINEHLDLLRSEGIIVFIDDFGSGYSALSTLSTLSIDGVKYDMAFAQDLESEDGYALFTSCLSISKALGYHSVLEGIETAKQYELAVKSGVDSIQGIYISLPIPQDNMAEFFQSKIDRA